MIGLMLIWMAHALLVGLTAASIGAATVFSTGSFLSGVLAWVAIVVCGYLHASRAGGLFSKLRGEHAED